MAWQWQWMWHHSCDFAETWSKFSNFLWLIIFSLPFKRRFLWYVPNIVNNKPVRLMMALAVLIWIKHSSARNFTKRQVLPNDALKGPVLVKVYHRVRWDLLLISTHEVYVLVVHPSRKVQDYLHISVVVKSYWLLLFSGTDLRSFWFPMRKSLLNITAVSSLPSSSVQLFHSLLHMMAKYR